MKLPVLVAVVGIGWGITTLPTFSTAATVAVVGFGAAEVAVAGLCRRRPPGPRRWRPRPPATGWVLPWGAALAVLAVWELLAFLGHPRSQHPTLSSMTDPLLAHHLVRAVAFGAWAWFGWVLAR
ncbi:MAG TPA: hypothetical protein VGP90_06110 [Acidimicrobiia bacterium]|nr:hypothetical protein [Acidimicrobiia bacterium]